MRYETYQNIIRVNFNQSGAIRSESPEPTNPGALAMASALPRGESEEISSAFLALKVDNSYLHALSIPRVQITVGRERLKLALDLPDEIANYVSRKHCIFSLSKGKGAKKGYLIRSVSETNGTYLNGRKLPWGRNFSISSGDLIRIAGLELCFFEGGESLAVGEG